ncbi:unnamed protein product [Lathyrus oleraceus]
MIAMELELAKAESTNSIAWNYTKVAIQEQNQRRGGGSLTYRSSSGGSSGRRTPRFKTSSFFRFCGWCDRYCKS